MNAKSFPVLIALLLPVTATWAAQRQDKRIDAATGEEVGVSARDGITISGTDVLVTRNGSTETLEADLNLSGGTRVSPDGTVTFSDGRKVTLGAQQLLTFDGRLLELPPSVSKGFPTGTGAVSSQTTTTSQTQTNTRAVGGRTNVRGQNNAIDGGLAGTGVVGTGFPDLVPITADTATSVTTDPRTGQPVYTAVNPATGRTVTTTKDPATGLSVTTTTDASGNRITRTQNPQTGMPVTTITDPSGRSRSTTIDPRTGRTMPGTTPSNTGTVGTTSGTSTTGTPSGLQPSTSGTGTTTTGTTTTGTTGTGTTGTTSGTRSGTGTSSTSGGTSGTSGGGTSAGGATSGGTAR